MNNAAQPVQKKSWKGPRALLLSFAVLATAVLVFYRVEDWRGWRAWQDYVQARTARGEKMDLASFVPPAVPEDQNFCECPLLKPIMRVRRVNGAPVWEDTNGWNHICSIRPGLDSPRLPPLITNGLVGWQAYYRSLSGNNLPDGAREDMARRYGISSPNAPTPLSDGLSALHLTNSPAEDVLLALGRLEPDFAELKRQAARRPLDRWAVNYGAESPLEIPLPHLARVKRICSVLALRETAFAAVGDHTHALSDLELGERLAESVRSEPFIISQIVRFACWELLLPPMREALRSHRLSEAQLADWQRRLLAVDLLPGYKLGFASESVCGGPWLNVTRKQLNVMEGFGPEVRGPFEAMARFNRFAPRGWGYRNQLALCRFSEDYLDPCVDPAARMVPPARTRALADAFARAKGPDSRLISLVFALQARFADLYFQSARLAHAQTLLDQAAVACALERYRLARGGYPESLEPLAPQFIPKLPHDLVNGRPLHYHRAGDGDYVLYSVGWNETDDGGRAVLKSDGTVDLKQGDWVW